MPVQKAQKAKATNKKKNQTVKPTGGLDREQKGASAYKTSGGKMGAGKSGTENLGSEKPSDGQGLGSQKPGKSGNTRKKK
jgi:hypothetical protein